MDATPVKPNVAGAGAPGAADETLLDGAANGEGAAGETLRDGVANGEAGRDAALVRTVAAPTTQHALALLDPYSPDVAATWRELEAIARPPYFLTWGWMENWLACLPPHEAPRLAVLTDDAGLAVAACFLGKRRQRRHGIVTSRAMHMNATGNGAYDELCLEHNSLLVHPDRIDAGTALAQLVARLPDRWDELYLPAADAETWQHVERATLPPGLRLRVDREVADFVVDLERVRAAKDGYVSLLGSSTRAQMRKAQRAAGDVTFEVAADERTAFDIYDELVALHQRSWRMRGFPGAFADPWFDRFHRRLIARRFQYGEIQLVRLRNAELTIGCLYNFVSAGRVLFYQCGLGAPADKHLRPGYLCHAFAIEHCARAGHAIYDLLGGDARYKQNLATDETRLVWGRVQQPRPQFALENRARAWLRGDGS